MQPNNSQDPHTLPPQPNSASVDPALQAYLQQLQQEVSRLTQQTQALQIQNHLLSGQSKLPPEPKLPLPSKFTVNRRLARSFLNQLELVFSANPSRYSTDQIRINTLGALLDGKPLNWLNPYLEKREHYHEMLTNYQIFREAFLLVWGEQDRVVVSENKLRTLIQGKSPSSIYAAEFKNLAADLEWNDAALRTTDSP